MTAAAKFTVTFFDDYSARYKREVETTLADLGETIKDHTAESKNALRWVKLAVFGNVVTKKKSLRHDANVQCVTGCEGDYDGEKIPFDDARDKLKKAGVEALLYTSPSHTPDLQRLLPIVLRSGTVGKDAPTTQAGHRYEDLVNRLHKQVFVAKPLQFSDAALLIREELEQRHLAPMDCEAINKKLAAHIGKYNGIFVRLCLLWHCIEGGKETLVDETTARRVAKFMHRFLLPHAVAFYAGTLGLSDDHERLTKVAGYILARKLDRITNRDVQRGDRAMRGLERQDMERIFAQLEALGWITRTPGPYAATRRTGSSTPKSTPVCGARGERSPAPGK
jgi:hypothetical protein